MNDFQCFDETNLTWTKYAYESPPSPRYRHGLASSGDGLYVFGGFGIEGEILVDPVAFEIAAYSWAHMYEADSNCRHYFADEISYYPTFNFQMAKICLLAGKPLSDLLFFNLQTLKWTNITGKVVGTLPAPRYGHGFAAANDSLFVFAGCGLDGGALFNFST